MTATAATTTDGGEMVEGTVAILAELRAMGVELAKSTLTYRLRTRRLRGAYRKRNGGWVVPRARLADLAGESKP